MLKVFQTAILALTLSVQLAVAQDFQKGLAYYDVEDYAAALKHWGPLAEAGNVDAQAGLASMYNFGWGVEEDIIKANYWYRQAAIQGDSLAQWILGNNYWIGSPPPRDRETALMWYAISFKSGYEQAARSMLHATGSLTAEEIWSAQQRAHACIESDYADCGPLVEHSESTNQDRLENPPFSELCPNIKSGGTICDLAKEVAAIIAPELPKQLSNNMRAVSIIALQNSLNIKVRLAYTEEHLNGRLSDLGVSRDVIDKRMVSQTNNLVCSDVDLEKFVLSGGVAGYRYVFSDGNAYLKIEVSKC
ncbi:Sel1-like repeat protein [Rhodobacterales bacterium HTCC2150]|nr:Sel1-like repeat protein [Rhodobacterales bacterium HTCC2150] [Rhodobacteraceae bacterium HTCC2150]